MILGVIFLVQTGLKIAKNLEDKETEDVVLDNQETNTEVESTTIQVLSNQEIVLAATNDYEASGIARRGMNDKLFSYVVIADLPTYDIDSEYYEGWLVKPGIVDFFSTGEMFVREDDKFGLLWELDRYSAPSDILEYSKVVITLESRNGDESPSAVHVLEGEFK